MKTADLALHSPAHPGAILREYMGEQVSVSALARHLGITRANLSMIVNGRLGITAATALKIAAAFPNTSPLFWMNLQNNFDLAEARKRKRRNAIKPLLQNSTILKG